MFEHLAFGMALKFTRGQVAGNQEARSVVRWGCSSNVAVTPRYETAGVQVVSHPMPVCQVKIPSFAVACTLADWLIANSCVSLENEEPHTTSKDAHANAATPPMKTRPQTTPLSSPEMQVREYLKLERIYGLRVRQNDI